MNDGTPRKLSDVTPAWVTEALKAEGVVGRAAVTAFTVEHLGEGRGFNGETARLHLRLDAPDPAAPETVVVKMAPGNDREVAFYMELAGVVDVQTPRCYFGHFDPEGGTGVLLLEDLRGGAFGDNVRGCSPREAELIVEQLASLHAPWWGGEELGPRTWLASDGSPARGKGRLPPWRRGRRLADSWDRFSEQCTNGVPDAIARSWPVMLRHRAALRREARSHPLTLCHGDARLDNIFFRKDGGDEALAFLDWQNVRQGQGIHDLAYFVVWSLMPDVRRRLEAELLHRYCTRLAERGVEGYAPELCGRGYRVLLYDRVLKRLVAAGARNDFSDPRGRALFEALLARTAAAVEDHPIEEVI